MMKTPKHFYIVVIVLLFLSSLSYAQETRRTSTLDHFKPEEYDKNAGLKNFEYFGDSHLECIYYYCITDFEKNHKDEYNDILQIGDSLSKYYGYFVYRRDSAFSCVDMEKLTNREYSMIWDQYETTTRGRDYILRNSNTQKMEVHGHIFIDYYVYQDSVPDMQWELHDDTLVVSKYLCHKATTTFRGRQWTAWYADEIPVSLGPWKLQGLPGLILMAYDATREHKFIACGVRPGTVKMVHPEHTMEMKTTRAKYNRGHAEFYRNPIAAIQGSGMVESAVSPNGGSAPRSTERSYVPLELE